MKYTTRKYEGDDAYSWAIFRAKDVKGIRGIIFYEDARPIMTGLGRDEARSRAKRLTEEGKEL